MQLFGAVTSAVSSILAQQGDGPLYGHKAAYEGGQQVGQITIYVMIGAVVLWGIAKVGAKLFKK